MPPLYLSPTRRQLTILSHEQVASEPAGPDHGVPWEAVDWAGRAGGGEGEDEGAMGHEGEERWKS